ncbi:MAG: hypothetical protein ACLPKT_12075, partial [Methylocella sp.]
MTPQQIASVDALKIESAEFTIMRQLATRFCGLLMGSSIEKLDVWLQYAQLSGVYAMQRFARAARQNFTAIRRSRSAGRLAKFVERVRSSAAAKDRHAIAGFYARRRKRPVRRPSAGLLDSDDKERTLGLPLDFLNRETGKGASLRRDRDRDFQPQCAEIQFHLAPALGILDDARDGREKDHRGDLLGANMSWKHDGVGAGLKELSLGGGLL